jgi:hypothetical protein
MKKLMTMRQALDDPELFAHPKGGLIGDSWKYWRVLLIAVMGEALTDAERVLFKEVTGREREPGEPVEEFWAILGRRSGKSRAIAVLAAYIAACCDFTDILAPGERGSLPIMSATTWQAGKVHQYLNGMFTEIPLLAALVIGQTADTISLSTHVDIECRPASWRTIRSGTYVAVIGDEVAFWRSEQSANPDSYILDAARPGLGTTGGQLFCITSPWARSGEAWKAYEQHFGERGDNEILVVRGPTNLFNPLISEKVIARAYKRDPIAAATEWGGEFRSDLESYISIETLRQHVIPGRIELPPPANMQERFNERYAFIDAAGGAGGGDAMVLSIAHAEVRDDGDYTIVLDVIRERSRFNPEEYVAELCQVLHAYGVDRVVGDAWGSQFVREQFEKRNVKYQLVSEVDDEWKSKSDLYRQLVPLLNSPGRLELLDNDKMVAQFVGLERKTVRGSNRDSIDHMPGAHDDSANAVAGALLLAGKKFTGGTVWDRFGDNTHKLAMALYGHF